MTGCWGVFKRGCLDGEKAAKIFWGWVTFYKVFFFLKAGNAFQSLIKERDFYGIFCKINLTYNVFYLFQITDDILTWSDPIKTGCYIYRQKTIIA